MGIRPWHKKLIKDNAKALLPLQSQLRRFKRALIPYESTLESDLLSLQQGIDMIKTIRKARGNLQGTVLELGSGWIPIVPLLFHVNGSSHLILTDVEKLLDEYTISLAKKFVRRNLDTICSELSIDGRSALEKIESFDFCYICPFDMARIEARSLDVIFSINVLEHIDPRTLDHILKNSLESLSSAGVMCHVIDNSDHWEHNDKSISRLNFLKYEKTIWRLMTINKQNYQNRLRHSDYADRFRRAGFELVCSDGIPDKGSMRDLDNMTLARPFAGRPKTDLAILTSRFVAKRPTRTCR